MTNNGIVNIHGKDYMTVARRVELWHTDVDLLDDIAGIETEILSHSPVVVKATVYYKGRKFTGISSVSLDAAKQIERSNPYEVAETSAVGRALGFAGYGIVEGIASADEMVKATNTSEAWLGDQSEPKTERSLACATCGEEATIKSGDKNGKKWTGVFCSTGDRTHTKWG